MARQLIEAIRKGDQSQATAILVSNKFGCIDCQTSRRDGTALFWACAKGFMELARLLISKGANVNARTSYNSTPLIAAADRNNYHIMSLLIQHGADVNSHTSSGDTACHFAAYRGYLEAVKILVDAGADLDVTNDKFRTPYDDAERQGHVTLLPYLDASHKLDQVDVKCLNGEPTINNRNNSVPVLVAPSCKRKQFKDNESQQTTYDVCDVNRIDYTDRIRGRDYYPDAEILFSSSHPYSATSDLTFTTSDLSFVPSSLPFVSNDLSSFVTLNNLSSASDSFDSRRRSFLTKLNIPS